MHMSEANEPGYSVPARTGRGPAALVIIAIALAGAILGVIATNAFAYGGFGPGRDHAGMLFGGDPAEADKRVEKMVKHFGVEVDASPEQQTRLIQIAKGLVRDVRPIREQLRDSRQQAIDLLGASTVDRGAVERLRVAQMQRFDQLSTLVTAAATEAAEVLTPEQRKELAQRIERFRDRMDRWRHG
jgi:periplasmic protein CpxP/Spy